MKRFFIFTSLVLFSLLQVSTFQPPTWKDKSNFEQFVDQQLNLHFSKLNAAPGSSSDKARALYYYVAGPPTSGYPDGHTGPANGLFGLVEATLKHPAVDEAFQEAGITGCSSLPITGSISVRGHSQGQLTLSFYPGRKTIPSHFAVDPGEIFDKRIQIDGPSQHLISVEMNCAADNIYSGYMVMESGRRLEFYYQFNTQTDAQQMDAYMDYPPALGNDKNEKLALRFEADDSDSFRFWGVRTTDDADEGSYGVAIEGDRRNNRAQIRVVEDTDSNPDDATALDAAAPSCVTLDGDDSTNGCDDVRAPGSTVHGNDFNIVGTDSIPVETIELIRADAPIYDFGSLTQGSTGNQTITLSNVGSDVISNIAASGLAAPFDFVGGAYPGTGGTCAASLAAGTTCLLVVEFAPSAAGSFSDNLILSYDINGLGYATTLDLNGMGQNLAPALLVISESDPFDYGNIVIGNLSNHTFTITNSGSLAATSMADAGGLAAPFTYTGGAYPGTGGTCSVSLAAAANCTIEVQFAPVSASVSNDSIDLSYNDGVAAQSVSRAVTGTGVFSASLSFSGPDPYDFGLAAVGSLHSHLVTVTNSGGATATSLSEVGLASPFGFTGGTFPGTAGTCGASLAAGASCDLEIQWAPTAIGAQADTVDLQYNDGASLTNVTLGLQATGAAPANLTISESDPFDFGSQPVGSAGSHIFTITNSGSVTATGMSGSGLASPFVFTGGAYPGGGTCASTLAAGGSCTVSVDFSPLVAGLANDIFSMDYNDGVASQSSTRSLQGTGVNPALLVISDADPFDFGSVSTGSTGSHVFTVTNTGGATATAISGSGLVAPFNFNGGAYPGTTGTCGATLAAGTNCSIDVEFAPIATGVHNDTIDINYNDSSAAQTATRNVTGTGI